MSMTDQFQKDMFLRIEDEIVVVTERHYKTQGRQGGLIILTYKGIKSGNNATKTVKAGTKFEEIVPDFVTVQYLYKEGEMLNFMNSDTYENIVLQAGFVGDYVSFMKEGDSYKLMIYEGEVLSIKKNQSVELYVTEAQEAVKGNTANTASKRATVETGYELDVPMFVKIGDLITINTETGAYTGRK